MKRQWKLPHPQLTAAINMAGRTKENQTLPKLETVNIEQPRNSQYLQKPHNIQTTNHPTVYYIY